jgi:hypothetical protein
MIDHPDRIPIEILDYSYLSHGPVKYIREDVVKAERNEIIEQCAELCDRKAWQTIDKKEVLMAGLCAAAIRALKEER